ncbi:MAG: hypothetical protein HY043_13915 [Verrucomicrobia bacterium]|nr:hypothetical protein [Verrucomicrobiota bacterium]
MYDASLTKRLFPVGASRPPFATKFAVIGLTALCLCLIGCGIASVYPFYTDKDLLFDPALVGRWGESGPQKDPDPIEFKKSGDKEYRLAMKDGDARADKYVVHLFKLRDQLYLNLFPIERHDDSIPVHRLMKVDQITPTLKMATLKDEWIESLLKKHPEALRHQFIPDPNDSTKQELVLTASTSELQRFLIKHRQTKGAFGEPGVWERR